MRRKEGENGREDEKEKIGLKDTIGSSKKTTVSPRKAKKQTAGVNGEGGPTTHPRGIGIKK